MSKKSDKIKKNLIQWKYEKKAWISLLSITTSIPYCSQSYQFRKLQIVCAIIYLRNLTFAWPTKQVAGRSQN